MSNGTLRSVVDNDSAAPGQPYTKGVSTSHPKGTWGVRKNCSWLNSKNPTQYGTLGERFSD